MANNEDKPQIELYTSGTPNGQKISITLEELNLPYSVRKIEIAKNEQKEEWFLKINPNGRIPAIVDKTAETSGFAVFEGAAIQLYLTSRYDPEHKLSFPYGSAEYWEMVSWLSWMHAGVGPMQGQANHFHRYAPEKIQYAIDRYQTETRRLYGILDARLAAQEAQGQGAWLVGGKYTIADLSCFSWVNWAEWAGIETEQFPALQKWLETIQKRPAVIKGVDVPEKFEMKEKMRSKEGEEAFAKHHSTWVMQGMKDDEEKHS